MRDPHQEPGLSFSQIFLNRVEFSQRPDALNLPPNTRVKPDNVDLEIGLLRGSDGKTAALSILVSSAENPEALYRFALEMIAVVQVRPEAENMDPVEFLESAGVSALFPFVREAVANLTMRGRFGPVWLAPINVAAMTEELRNASGVATVGDPKLLQTTRSSRKSRPKREAKDQEARPAGKRSNKDS